MAFAYPLSLPATKSASRVELFANSPVGISTDPFTFKSQRQTYTGQRWEANVTLPPMVRADAEQWITFLLKLNGVEGTFLMGDTLGQTPRGLAQYTLQNVVVSSEDLTAWTNENTTGAGDTTTAPDGTLTADTVTASAVTGRIGIYKSVSGLSGTASYRSSIFLKRGNHDLIVFGDRAGSSWATANINLSTGVINNTTGVSSATIETRLNDWFLITLNYSDPGRTTYSSGVYFSNTTSATPPTGWTPAGTEQVYAWGAMLQESTSDNVYIKTTTQQVQPSAPLVNGADQTGQSLVTDGWSKGVTNILRTGDYIQLQTPARLYKVLNDVTSDINGNAILDIWPPLRGSPSNNASITTSSCVGTFALSQSNYQIWSIGSDGIYSLAFSAMERI